MGLLDSFMPAVKMASVPEAVKIAEQAEEQPKTAASGWSAFGVTGAAGRAWSYITKEAAAADTEAPPPEIPRPSMHITLDIRLQGKASKTRLS